MFKGPLSLYYMLSLQWLHWSWPSATGARLYSCSSIISQLLFFPSVSTCTSLHCSANKKNIGKRTDNKKCLEWPCLKKKKKSTWTFQKCYYVIMVSFIQNRYFNYNQVNFSTCRQPGKTHWPSLLCSKCILLPAISYQLEMLNSFKQPLNLSWVHIWGQTRGFCNKREKEANWPVVHHGDSSRLASISGVAVMVL